MYVRPSTQHAGQCFAAIDIGSNSIHLIVARVDKHGHMDILDSEKMTVRLGDELRPDGRLTKQGIDRAVKAIKHMVEIAAPYDCGIRAVATHAAREAVNQQELIDAIFRGTRIRVEVIDGLEEARLVFLGMRYGLPLEGQVTLGVDIGGGSTEIIVARGDKVLFVTSLKIGAVTLSKNEFLGANPSPKKIKQVYDHIYLRIVPLIHDLKNLKFKRAVASSGTAKAIGVMHARIKNKKILMDENGYRFSSKDLKSICEELEELKSAKNIRDEMRLDPSRAEIILAGTMILNCISKAFQVPGWQVTTFGLREGVLMDSFHRKHPSFLGEEDDVRWQSVVQFGDRAEIRRSYAEKVRFLTASLYDQLMPKIFPKASREALQFWREIIQAAAYLTEVGRFISSTSFHKHSYYMIYHGRIMGFTEYERHFVGLIVRYHRKSIPDRKHLECKQLGKEEFEMLNRLTGIVRMAASLNRTRRELVKDVKVRLQGKTAVLRLQTLRNSKAYGEVHQFDSEFDAVKSTLGFGCEIKG